MKKLKETQGYWLEDTFLTFEIEPYDNELNSVICRWCGEYVAEWLQATGYTPIDYLMDETGEGEFKIIRDFVGAERFWIKPTDFCKN